MMYTHSTDSFRLKGFSISVKICKIQQKIGLSAELAALQKYLEFIEPNFFHELF